MNIEILKLIEKLSIFNIKQIDNYQIINPYNSEKKDDIQKITKKFYNKFYKDNNKRRLILGSNPVRKGTAITGLPYEDANHLNKITGISIEEFNINKSSSNFLYEVIEKYGGSDKFYNDFYMNFVFPFGITKTNSKGNEINCNYYENKKLQTKLYNYIVDFINELLKLNIDTSVCYCIGSEENYKFLSEINNKYRFFKEIVPLEHPRYIMQYNSKNKEEYLKKYLEVLSCK